MSHKKVARNQQIAKAYTLGMSSRALAKANHISTVRVRQILEEQNVERRPRGQPRKPMFDTIMRRARGEKLLSIAAGEGVSRVAITLRFQGVGVQARYCDLSPLLKLSNEQLNAYKEALDTDGLQHADALEIAMEY